VVGVMPDTIRMSRLPSACGFAGGVKRSTIALFIEGGTLFSVYPELKISTMGFSAMQHKKFNAGYAPN